MLYFPLPISKVANLHDFFFFLNITWKSGNFKIYYFIDKKLMHACPDLFAVLLLS